MTCFSIVHPKNSITIEPDYDANDLTITEHEPYPNVDDQHILISLDDVPTLISGLQEILKK